MKTWKAETIEEAAGWLAQMALLHPESQWSILATSHVMAESCLMLMFAECTEPEQVKRMLPGAVTFKNGSRVRAYSAEFPSRMRGSMVHGGWIRQAEDIPAAAIETFDFSVRNVLAFEKTVVLS